MRSVFFGSGDFPIPCLRALVEAGRPPVQVVTRPDAPRGRGRKVHPAEVRLAAEELGLPCRQPTDPCAGDFRTALAALEADLFLVVSFGRIFPGDFLEIPGRYSLNVHASLLPRHRGAAPIQHTILAGDRETGITVQRMEERLDAGDVLLAVRTAIGPRETAGELRERLAAMAGPALVEALGHVERGTATFTPQDHGKATRAPAVRKADGVIDWSRPAVELDHFVRAMTPVPGARTRLGARRYIVVEGVADSDGYGLGIPGGVLSAGEEGIRICAGEGIYRVVRLKPENGRTMTAGEFVRGHPIQPEARFG